MACAEKDGTDQHVRFSFWSGLAVALSQKQLGLYNKLTYIEVLNDNAWMHKMILAIDVHTY